MIDLGLFRRWKKLKKRLSGHTYSYVRRLIDNGILKNFCRGIVAGSVMFMLLFCSGDIYKNHINSILESPIELPQDTDIRTESLTEHNSLSDIETSDTEKNEETEMDSEITEVPGDSESDIPLLYVGNAQTFPEEEKALYAVSVSRLSDSGIVGLLLTVEMQGGKIYDVIRSEELENLNLSYIIMEGKAAILLDGKLPSDHEGDMIICYITTDLTGSFESKPVLHLIEYVFEQD